MARVRCIQRVRNGARRACERGRRREQARVEEARWQFRHHAVSAHRR